MVRSLSIRASRWTSKLRRERIYILAFVIAVTYVLIKFSHYYFVTRRTSIVTLKLVEVLNLTEIESQYVSKESISSKNLIEPTAKSVSSEIFKSSHNQEKSKSTTRKCSVTLAIILCNDGSSKKEITVNNVNGLVSEKGNKYNKKFAASVHLKPARNFDRQINQTIVLLKSIVLQQQFSEKLENEKFDGNSPHISCVNVLVLSDQISNFERVKKIIHDERWSDEFVQRINLIFVPVSYPPGSEWMRKLFRPCATLRLFLAELLPQYDSVIYLDTDIIFLRNVLDLWGEFYNFQTDRTLAAMAPCLNHYGTSVNKIPFYGTTGLNAGIMLMNLTRIRSSGWTQKIREVTSAYQHEIKLADQDILNIYFHSNPKELHELTCDWNFRPFQCRRGSFCEDPTINNGISALHGNALSFTPEGPEPLFHSVFTIFQNLNLSEPSFVVLDKLIRNIYIQVGKVQQISKSDCSRFGALQELILLRLNSMLAL